MKPLIPLILLALAGCQDSPPAVGQLEPPQTAEPAAVEPAKVEPQVKDPRIKAQRIHQLKDLETRKIQHNGHTLTVWIMDDASKRAEGMMWLEDKDVKDTEGMLFVFNDAQPRSFWMQNCPLGLDIAYIDATGKVLNVGIGKPYDESGVPSKGAARYVLELKSGRAKKFGIRAGTKLVLPKNLKSKDGG